MGQTKKEISRFILAGFCAVGTDCFTYYLLTKFLPVDISKSISFLTGTFFAYLINKYYTFEQKQKSVSEVFKFLGLYLFTLCANVGVNKLSFLILPTVFSYFPIVNSNGSIKLFAFLMATGTSTILNFLGQKFFVFKRKVSENSFV